MKNELGITKGEWEASGNGVFVKGKSDNIAVVSHGKNSDANTKLIAEAGTVANETGKTPRQLADDNKVLLVALQNMRVMYWQWIEQHPETQGYKWAKEALSAIKQVTE